MKVFNIKIIKDLIEDTQTIEIHKSLWINQNCLKLFNSLINGNIKPKFGIYIWENIDSNEIIYLGKAGTIKNDGTKGSHTLKNRLTATRCKDPITKKDITTNKYLMNYMLKNQIDLVKIHVLYCLDGVIPGYVEAILLNTYFQEHKKLPKLNNAF